MSQRELLSRAAAAWARRDEPGLVDDAIRYWEEAALQPPLPVEALISAARARRLRFEKASGMASDALHETSRDVAVIVLHENDASFQTWFAAEFVNFLNQSLACFVARMRFAGENKLHRTRRIVHQSFRSFLVAK